MYVWHNYDEDETVSDHLNVYDHHSKVHEDDITALDHLNVYEEEMTS